MLVLLLNTKQDYEIFKENPSEHVQFDEDLVESKVITDDLEWIRTHINI